jgi:hypothetical protein
LTIYNIFSNVYLTLSFVCPLFSCPGISPGLLKWAKGVNMIGYAELVKYFTNEVPYALGLKFPEACGKIVKNIIFRESADKEFLPAENMTPTERAQFAICDTGGYHENTNYSHEANKQHFDFIKSKFLLIAEALILNHETIDHPERMTGENKKRIGEINYLLSAHALTEFEKELISPTTNGWTFAPAEHDNRINAIAI